MVSITLSERSLTLPSQLHGVLNSPLTMLLVAFVLRLGVMLYMQSFQFPPGWDNWKFGFETGRIARSIASGEGFSSPLQGFSGPTAWLPPLYPYLIAGIFRVFGIYSIASALVALTLNSLFSALTCVTVYAIGCKTFGPKVAVWAGWGWAFFPYAIFWSTHWVWAITLAAFLFSLVFLVALYLEHCNTAEPWLGFGLLWGLVALTDTVLLSTFPFFLAWLCYRLKQQGMALYRAISAFTLMFVLMVSPWLLRNYLTFGELVFIKGNFGVELHVANYEGSTGLSAGLPLHPAANEHEIAKLRQMGELPYVAEKKGQALRFIAAHPGTFIWLSLKRVLYFWTGTPQLMQIFRLSGRFVTIRYVLFTSVSVLAFCGLFLAFYKCRPAVPLFAIPLIVFPLAYYVTHPTPRYRHPIEPAMVLLAAYVITNIFSRPSLQKQEAGMGETDVAEYAALLCSVKAILRRVVFRQPTEPSREGQKA
jgi:4-amino-4-deoxy-L-arabinose transferase-like glycosyltransferase